MSNQALSVAGELSRGIQLHRAGDLQAARTIYERILAVSPNHADALNLCGVVAHQTGDQETAIQLIEQAIGIDSTNAGYYNNLGEAYRVFNRNDQAVAAYESALALNPADVAANNNLGLALQKLQRYEEAVSAFERALSRAPNDVEVLLNLGNLHREFCDLEASATAFRKAIDVHPGLAAGHASLGVTLYEAGETQAAIASLLTAVDLDPLYLEAHENLKKIRWFQGQHDKVDASFREACERLRGSARAFTNLGIALLASGDHTGAEQALLEATRLDSNGGEAFDALGQVYRYLGRPQDALDAHERAVERMPRNALFREEFGATLILAGEHARAVRELRTGHALNPRRSSMLGYLTIALNELGDDSVNALVDYDRFVRVAAIEVPDGFESLQSFNVALHDELEKQHRNPYHPMDQTMRGGTQTANNLFQNPTGLVRVLKQQISAAVSQFIGDLEHDPGHPFLRFINPGFVFTGAWSTILREQGFDGNHVHNEGWVSGTYYARIPEFDQNQMNEHEGCIQFGAPSATFASERNATRRLIAPEVGSVVLFPSYYWHGVRAFGRNGVRHSVSYDLI